MKACLLPICLCSLFLLTSSCNRNQDPYAYLEKVLKNLDKIESATYHEVKEAWNPGEIDPTYRVERLVREYNNPQDTTIGASYVAFDLADPTRLEFAYDGTVRVIMHHKHNGLMIDDFSTNTLPFRLVNPPFFNYTKNILRYMLTTQDSIHIDFVDMPDEYYIKMTIEEEKQVEFFGKAHYIENPYYDPLSIYELWISKSTNRPYKVRQEMGHSISASTISNPEFNKLSLKELNVTDYFPENYEIRDYGSRRNSTPRPLELEGKPAPAWTLNNSNEQPVSLTDIHSKVVLLNFTGIGCGPCLVAIPFMRELKETFPQEELEVVSIETWNRRPVSLQNYINRNEINYQLLCGTDEVIQDYQSRGVPTFFILDNQRIVRKAIVGYSKDSTDQEILEAIRELL
ncbi:MAG: TlpA family protein disulfide reductase [Tannerellaceae bacterium]|nr:TlpA family protein disulfide reductase [Tannerellaceae bacterium]